MDFWISWSHPHSSPASRFLRHSPSPSPQVPEVTEPNTGLEWFEMTASTGNHVMLLKYVITLWFIITTEIIIDQNFGCSYRSFLLRPWSSQFATDVSFPSVQESANGRPSLLR